MHQFLSLADHAADLSISLRTVRNAISLGKWPAKTVLLGRRRLVPRAEHERPIAQLLRFGKVSLNEPLPNKLLVVNEAGFGNDEPPRGGARLRRIVVR